MPNKNILHQREFSGRIIRFFRDIVSNRNEIIEPFFKKKLLYHSIGWLIFIFYELFFITILLGQQNASPIFSGYVFPYMVNIGLFYFNAHFVLNKSIGTKSKRYSLFLFLTALELFCYLILMNIRKLEKLDFQWINAMDEDTRLTLFRQLWRAIYFMGFSSAYWFTLRTIDTEKRILRLERMQILDKIEKNRLEKNIVELQNAHLQSQVNPHLLFNTLNFIYNKVQQVSQEASDVVILLSELMNFSLRELEEDGKVDLSSEIEQINNIVKINQIRFNNKLFLELNTKGNFDNARIVPLLLVPIIENFFKHGDMSEKTKPGKISISYDGKYLEMTTQNIRKRRSKIYSHGIGIVNLKKRLANLYDEQYSLIMKSDDNVFCTTLRIKL